MSDRINIAKSVMSFEESPESLPFGEVLIHTPNDDVAWRANGYSDIAHRTLELSTDFNNFGSNDAMYIAEKIAGYKYQAYSASGAITDPAIQLGDIVVINGTTSIAASIDIDFDSLCACDISAPDGGEVVYEYQYKDETQRSLSRKVSTGATYSGTSIDGTNGFTAVCGNAKIVFNNTEISFYVGDNKAIYYDSTANKFVLNTAYINVL